MNAISQMDCVTLVRESRLFDAEHYASQSELYNSGLDELIRHYVDIGERSGLTPNALFDPTWYFERGYGKQRRPEVALLDYISRNPDSPDPHPLFDQAFYLEQARKAGCSVPAHLTPLAHYIITGAGERIDPHPLFSNTHYLEENSDVRTRGYNPLLHFLTNGWSEGRSPCAEFDCAYYLRENADVAAAQLNPLIHYVSSGARERRNPSAAFDTAWYVRLLHADPAAETLNPLVHYVRVGRRLGYPARPRSFTLDDQGMMPREDFEIFAESGRLVLQSLQRAGQRQPLVLVCGASGEGEGTIPGAIAPEELPEMLAGLNEAAIERCIVLFVSSGDTLLPGALDSIVSGFGTATWLLTADSVCFDGESALPVLLPGSNPTYLRYTANVPPFAVRAAFYRDHGRLPDEAAHTWFQRLVTAAIAVDDRALRHLPLPVVASPLARYRAANEVIPPEVERIATSACGAEPSNERSLEEDVSVIICTKDCGQLLAQLVMQLLRPDMPHVREVLIVVNQPGNAFARAYHRQLAHLPRVRILDYPRDYNFSDQCNVGARAACGGNLLFLNDDVAPVGVRWLGHMIASLADPAVAVVGPLLLYPDETVQHAGMFLGFNNVAGHCMRGVRLPRNGSGLGLVPADCSCVTGAVMLVRADVFAALNGFDYQLATYLQDVDFCLRVLRTGRRIVFNPYAILFHMESISAATILRDPSVLDRRGREYQRFARRWGASVFNDRYHNVNWSKQDEQMATLTSVDATTLQTELYG